MYKLKFKLKKLFLSIVAWGCLFSSCYTVGAKVHKPSYYNEQFLKKYIEENDGKDLGAQEYFFEKAMLLLCFIGINKPLSWPKSNVISPVIRKALGEELLLYDEAQKCLEISENDDEVFRNLENMRKSYDYLAFRPIVERRHSF